MLLERALLIQEKRIWSQAQLKLLDEGLYKANVPANEKARTRELLLSNLRVSKEVLDRLALDLGYESPTIRKLLGDQEADLPDALELHRLVDLVGARAAQILLEQRPGLSAEAAAPGRELVDLAATPGPDQRLADTAYRRQPMTRGHEAHHIPATSTLRRRSARGSMQ